MASGLPFGQAGSFLSRTSGRGGLLGELVGQAQRKTAVPENRRAEAAVQMLDAAHGKGIGPIASGQRIHKGAVEPQQAPVMIVRDHGRRGPRIAIRADIAQVSRSAGAVARSRPGIREQSLEWMPRRGNKFNSEFTTLRLSESKDRSWALPSKSKVKPRRGLIQNAKL